MWEISAREALVHESPAGAQPSLHGREHEPIHHHAEREHDEADAERPGSQGVCV
jgi:hypothetical protein